MNFRDKSSDRLSPKTRSPTDNFCQIVADLPKSCTVADTHNRTSIENLICCLLFADFAKPWRSFPFGLCSRSDEEDFRRPDFPSIPESHYTSEL